MAAGFGTAWLVAAIVQASVGTASPLIPGETTTTTVAPTTTTAPPVEAPVMTEREAIARLLELTNGARAQHGLAPLAARGDIADIARGWSVKLSAAGALSHNDAYFTDENRRHLDAVLLGENVARNGDIDDAHRMLMASPPHRANILDGRFSAIGLGAVSDGASWWITQDFVQAASHPAPAGGAAAPTVPTPTAAAPAAPAPAPARAPDAAMVTVEIVDTVADAPVQAQSASASAVSARDFEGGSWSLPASMPAASSEANGNVVIAAAALAASAMAGLLAVSRRRAGRAPASPPRGDAASTSPSLRSGGFAHA